MNTTEGSVRILSVVRGGGALPLTPGAMMSQLFFADASSAGFFPGCAGAVDTAGLAGFSDFEPVENDLKDMGLSLSITDGNNIPSSK